MAVLTNAAALDALRPEWEALWARLPDAGPFQSPAWLIPWWAVFGQGGLVAIALRRAGRLVGVAPLYRAEPRRILPLGIGISDDLDPLLDPAEPDLAATLLRRLAALAPDAVIAFHALPERSAVLAAPPPAGWRDAVGREATSPALDLPDSLAAFTGRLGRTVQRNLRTAEKRAARLGPLICEAARPADGFDALVRLHAASWAARGGGVLADPAVQRFHRLALPQLAAAGILRLYRLRIGDRTVAVYYGFCRGGRACAYLGGFAPGDARQSFGTIMVFRAIAEAIREGARRFDFLRGDEPYKYAWGARDRPLFRRILTPPP